MNSRWQANKIGLINFWYYDEQEFPFVKGRMLLRGSNGSGKSVTMQSVVPLLLDGNMSPERLDPFGSRDRKMSSYLLEENDGREERTGYLYLEFKRKDSETYLTIGMGIRAKRNKPLDKWYFSLTDGRRIGKDFFLYKDMGEKVTLSKKELENRVAEGGRVFDRQADYMDYVNRQIFGFETADEYKEMVDLLIQLRTPKLSKDFKPSVINDILSDSLQPLSDEDLRPMSEAIENMDMMNMNLKGRREARGAAEKINAVFQKYNKLLLCEKADRYERTKQRLQKAAAEQKAYEDKYAECNRKIEELETEILQMNQKKETLEKEKESLNKSDAVALKGREAQLTKELEAHDKILADKKSFLAAKETQYRDVTNQIKEEENRKYISDNVLFHHDTLPMGEFAIGTNTTAYRMARVYDIAAKMPILIAEKTGPHFAVGDTCYTYDEDNMTYNPDGKAIIARDNSVSIRRKDDISKAYFNCHTDITIPYDELGAITVIRHDGSTCDIIRDGRFVLEGVEALNKPLDTLDAESK